MQPIWTAPYFCHSIYDRLHGSDRDLYGIGDGGVGEAVGDGVDVAVFIVAAVEAGGLAEAWAREFVDFGA